MKIIKGITVIVWLAMAIAAASCSASISDSSTSAPDRELQTRTVDVEPFSAIYVDKGVTVNFTQDEMSPIEIEAEKRAIDLVEVKQTGGKIHITLREKHMIRFGHNMPVVNVHVSAPTLSRISVSSGAAFNASEGIKQHSRIKIDAKGGAAVGIDSIVATNIRVNVQCGARVNVERIVAGEVISTASTGSSASLSGTCATLRAEATTGSRIEASQLKAIRGTATGSLGSKLTVDVQNLSSTADQSSLIRNACGERDEEK